MPSDNVASLGFNGNLPAPSYGTSFAAPLVSGVAGLLLSFDPTISNLQLKDLLVQGALAGGISVDTKPLLNAYESLKQAANRTSAPLCGNRIWASGGIVYAQRQGGAQVLYSSADTVSYLYTYHGGRRVDFGTSTSSKALTYNNGAWTLQSGLAGLPAELSSSTWSSEHGFSHQMDSVAYWNRLTVPGGIRIDISYGTSFSIGRPLGTMTVPLQTGASDSTCGQEVATYDSLGSFAGYQCVAKTPFSDWGVLSPQTVASPAGDRILIVLNRDTLRITGLSPWVLCLGGSVDSQGNWSCRRRGATGIQSSVSAEVWQIPLAGGTPSFIWSRSGQGISWLGFSEDSRRAVMGTGSHSFTTSPPGEAHTNCAVEYVNPLSGVADTVVSNPLACRAGQRGPGGFSSIKAALAPPPR